MGRTGRCEQAEQRDIRWSRRSVLRGVVAGSSALAGCQVINGDSTPTATSTPRNDLAVTWSTGPEMPYRRTQTTAVALDGELYVIGGIVEAGDRHVAVYNPTEQRWRRAAPPPKPVNHTSAVTYDGRVHVFGGYSGSFLGSPPLDAHWVYDPDADAWSAAPSLPTARGALVAVVAGDRIYTIGGATEEGTTNIVEAYDPSDGSWQQVTAMPTAREHLAAGVIDGAVYVAGGRQGLSPMVATTERYTPREDEWTQRASMPTARAGIAGAVLGGRLFVFGGEEVSEQVFEEVEAYHPPSDSWTAVESLPTPRWGLGVATLEGSIYTVGGGAVPSAEETRVLEIMTAE